MTTQTASTKFPHWKRDKLSLKEWADYTASEYIATIKAYIAEGIDKPRAFHLVMDNSTLGEGYRAQIRKEIGLGIFD